MPVVLILGANTNTPELHQYAWYKSSDTREHDKMTIKGFWTFFCLWLSLHDEKSWTRCLICIIPCLCICICICLRPCLFLAVSQFSKMINLRCAALYALFLAQGQAAVYQGVLISTQCILIFSNINIWSFNQHTMHFDI